MSEDKERIVSAQRLSTDEANSPAAVNLRPSTLETTALGAAYLAGLAVGYWADLSEIRRNWQVSAAFSPAAESEKIKEKLAGWHHAVRQARLSDEAE